MSLYGILLLVAAAGAVYWLYQYLKDHEIVPNDKPTPEPTPEPVANTVANVVVTDTVSKKSK